ncbi:MAG: nucleotidyl transferase AbiEii/AbiGii toxin family protein [Candidatus Eremiobacteraeota bacterium]|nr:nucleotidyl transferase AbiEii/AbiGii toxin family protein [Candidatus Eremiobacteraeota bacterium]
MIEPKVPASLDPLAREILEQLRGDARVANVVLGGGIALAHYVEYRPTRDIDAWWGTARMEEARVAIASAVKAVAERHGLGVRQRSWGETLSYEIMDMQENRVVFAFQIAPRDIQLEEPRPSEWSPLLLETLTDNLGSKMNALVDRGAPRDFLDIYELMARGLYTPQDCWSIWQRKNPDADGRAARNKVLHNLLSIEARTPLDSVSAAERQTAQRRRIFFKTEFVRNDAS